MMQVVMVSCKPVGQLILVLGCLVILSHGQICSASSIPVLPLLVLVLEP